MQDPLRENPGRAGLRGFPRPVDISPKWASGVVTKARSVRVAALAGLSTFEDPEIGYVLPEATGIIELTGSREGAVRTSLLEPVRSFVCEA